MKEGESGVKKREEKQDRERGGKGNEGERERVG